MDAGQVLLIAIPVVAIAAAVLLIATSRRRDATFSAEARRRDRSATGEVAPLAEDAEATATAEGRERAERSKELVTARTGAPARRGGAVARRDPEEIAVTRRQFFNRGIVGSMALALGGFGTSVIAFLWPTASGGFGGIVKTPDTKDNILVSLRTKKEPYYVPEARTYLVEYPEASIPNAEKAYTGALEKVVQGIKDTGLVGLYQKCVHLGCRVPWCQSAQWFECPCHGSKYNRVGEKRGGPAPRGLDRWPIQLNSDGTIQINTGGTVIQGPPIGTNTTGQEREGPDCI